MHKLLKKAVLIIALMAVGLPAGAQTQAATENNDKFKLIELPYPTNALEPVISQKTVELHYGKHLRGYVANVNKLTKNTPFADADLETIVRQSNGSLYDNAGQMLNHNLYFTQFAPNAGGQPTGDLAEAINKSWGDFDKFREAFIQAGTGLFGSGWVWLAQNADGRLVLATYANGGNPVSDGLTPILGIDVWEHAYYLDYQNRRADHLKAVWQIIDWKVVGARYHKPAKK